MSDTHFDYIIVGAGTAGALLANRLSRDSQCRVLLIEAGRRDDYHWIHIPVGYLHCIGNPRVDWMFQTETISGLNGRRLRYPRGKVLGGCSSINGMIYMRGQSRDYDQWAELTGDSSWRWANCLPYFIQHEDHHGGANSHHGSGGEWRVEQQRLSWQVLEQFSQAAQQAGIPATPDFNRGNNEGVAYFEVNQKAGFRWNSAKAFLRPTCYGRPNFELWTHAQVARIITETDPQGALRASGVECLAGHVHKGQMQYTRVTAHAHKEVILCAGAIGTPQLLQLSGLGPADLLQKHKIPLILDLPGVGANLQDHLQLRSVYKVTGIPTLNTMANSWWGKARIALEYAWRRTGPMSMAPSQLGAFTKSHPDLLWPNLQYHVQPLSLEAFGEPLHDFNAITASVCNLNPSSRGHVHLSSADPLQGPRIQLNYLSTAEDRQIAADSLRVTRRIMQQAAMAPFQPQEIKPGVQYQSDEDLARLAGDIGTTIFHPVGTAKMGHDQDPEAVVNSRLQVRGVKSLRIADASIMPRITSGNTNAPTLMIAERAAEWIIQDKGNP
jgi:choline dehydrogenase